jgi:hypothetical protein
MLQSSNSTELQLIAAQSMKASILLSCKQTKDVSTIGDVYLRIFLPLLIGNIDNETQKIESGDKTCLPIIEDELKTLLTLSLTHPVERLSNFVLIRISFYQDHASSFLKLY